MTSMDGWLNQNWVRRMVSSQPGDVHDYSCVMVDIPKELKEKILAWNLANIPETELFKEDKNSKGRELAPHVTVKYGVHEVVPDPVLAKIPNRVINFELGPIARFTSGGLYDVILVEILSPELHTLNSVISSSFKCTDSFPEYKPHLTLAYVNKGALPQLDGNHTFAEVKGQFDTVLFTNPQGDQFTKIIKGTTAKSEPVVSGESMAKSNHKEFVWMEKKGEKAKIFASGLVFLFSNGKMSNESYPCLMSAIHEYEKHGFCVVGEVSKTVPMGESGFVEIYPYTKEFHDALESSGFNQVGPWENNWAWKFLAVKSHMFSIGLNPIDATKGIEMEITQTPKFKEGETISLGKNNLCRAYDVEGYSGDLMMEVSDEVKVSEVQDSDYILDFGYFEDVFLHPSDPESKSVRVRELIKAIEEADSTGAYVDGPTTTLPFKVMKE